MIQIYSNKNLITKTDIEMNELEFRGLSTDEKPTTIDNKDVPNGSVFIEIDTGKIYLYDLDNEQWKEM